MTKGEFGEEKFPFPKEVGAMISAVIHGNLSDKTVEKEENRMADRNHMIDSVFGCFVVVYNWFLMLYT